jgi:transcriptional regulator with XRE-family HTH domain
MSANYDNRAISERINALLRSHDMTRYKLSQVTGVGESTLSSYFSRNSKWGIDVVAIIAEYFKVSLDWLILGKESNESNITAYSVLFIIHKYNKIFSIPNKKSRKLPAYGLEAKHSL